MMQLFSHGCSLGVVTCPVELRIQTRKRIPNSLKVTNKGAKWNSKSTAHGTGRAIA